ncbi:DnaB-like helicase C-terminal domain-containing protein [Ureibacillus composti]|nr:DnaB-like helicase C-terminal domain-containing protein [Ureibacillus composti]
MRNDISIELLEKTILGTMLQENYLIFETEITQDMFQMTIHRRIFRTMQELVGNQQHVDYITILMKRNPEEVGGANYLASINGMANLEKFDNYLQLFMERWQLNQLQRLLSHAQQESWSFQRVQTSLDQIEINTNVDHMDITNELVTYSELPFQHIEETGLIPTKIDELDKLIDGFREGEVTIIAGRPSMGKTDVMNHFALQAGWAGYLPIIFSLEMSRKMLAYRLIANTGNINRLKMRDPYKYLSERQKDQWMQVLELVRKAQLKIDDHGGLTVSQIRAKARRVIKTHPTLKPIIFIDYLQIIRSELQGNPTTIIGQISWELKQMAKELNCPVVCLAQLNRGVETRQDKRPVMSDLRDSGNIEQDADVIILLYRDGYYRQGNKEGMNGLINEKTYEDELEFIVAKNRNGPTGVAHTRYNKLTGRIGGKSLGNAINQIQKANENHTRLIH